VPMAGDGAAAAPRCEAVGPEEMAIVYRRSAW
jgi:hypothetical protein